MVVFISGFFTSVTALAVGLANSCYVQYVDLKSVISSWWSKLLINCKHIRLSLLLLLLLLPVFVRLDA